MTRISHAAGQASTLPELYRVLQFHPAALDKQTVIQQWKHLSQSAMGWPDPTVTLGANNLPLNAPADFDRYLPTSKSIELMQSVPNRSGRKATRSRYLAQADLAALQLAQLKAELKQRLLVTVAQRQRITTSLHWLARQLELLDELERWLTGEVESGSGVYARFDEIDIKRGTITESTLKLQGEDLQWQAEQQELLGFVPGSVSLKGLQPTLWDGDETRFFAVRQAMLAREVAASEVAKKRADFGWDMSFGVAWQQREAGENFDGDDWITMKLSFKVPLWSASNQQPRLRAAQEIATGAEHNSEQQRRESLREYQMLTAGLRTSEDLLLAKKRRVAQLGDLQQTSQHRYESGEGTLEDVLRPALQRAELEIEIADVEAQRDIAIAKRNALILEQTP